MIIVENIVKDVVHIVSIVCIVCRTQGSSEPTCVHAQTRVGLSRGWYACVEWRGLMFTVTRFQVFHVQPGCTHLGGAALRGMSPCLWHRERDGLCGLKS